MRSSFRDIDGRVWRLLFSTTATATGYFMSVPMLAVQMVQVLRFSPLQMGIIVGFWVLVIKGLSFGGAMVASKIGMKNGLILGLILRSIGFIWIDHVQSFSLLLLAVFSSALGAALFVPPLRAAILLLSTEGNRKKILGYQQMAFSFGQILGPTLGALVLKLGLHSGFSLNALIYFALLPVVISVKFPEDHGEGQKSPEPVLTLLKQAKKDRVFLVFAAISVSFFIMLTQLRMLIPYKVLSLFSDLSQSNLSGMIAYVSLVNALVIVLGQLCVIQFFKHVAPQVSFQMGLFLSGSGLFVAGITGQPAFFFLGVAIFSLGQVFVLPSIGHYIASRVSGRLVVIYYGITDIAWAIGGVTGNLFGAFAKEVLPPKAPLPWITFLVLGVTSALLVSFLVVRKDALAKRVVSSESVLSKRSGRR